MQLSRKVFDSHILFLVSVFFALSTLTAQTAFAAKSRPVQIDGVTYYILSEGRDGDVVTMQVGVIRTPCQDGRDSCLIKATIIANCGGDRWATIPEITITGERAEDTILERYPSPRLHDLYKAYKVEDEMPRLYQYACK